VKSRGIVLVTAGILLAPLPFGAAIPLSPDGIFTIFLPPLIFEAALQIGWPAYENLPVTLLLALRRYRIRYRA
jgi:CPA1 family monovalent cation:H+ antiporter